MSTLTDDYGAEFAAHMTAWPTEHWHLRLFAGLMSCQSRTRIRLACSIRAC